MKPASTLSCALLALLAADFARAAAPRLAAPDPLALPSPALAQRLIVPADDQRAEAKIVPGLWRRLQQLDPDEEIALIIELQTPRHRITAAAHSEEWDREKAELTAAIEHRFAARAQRLVTGLRGLSHFPIVFGRARKGDVEAVAELPEVYRVYEDEVVHALRVEGGALIRSNTLRAQLGATGAGIAIAVLDTGIDAQHPELAGRVEVQGDFTGTTGDGTVDDVGHGTSVAGILAGHSGGVAPGAGLWALKVIRADGQSTASSVLEALNAAYAARNSHGGLDVINLSLGSGGPFNADCDAVSPYTSVFNALYAAGVAIFAAGGNSGFAAGISHPACHSKVIAVGSVYDADVGARTFPDVCVDAATQADQIPCYSNSGNPLDLLAPAQCVWTPAPGASYNGCFGGTSAASPYAAGVAAQLLQLHPGTSPAQLRNALMSTGRPIAGAYQLTRNRIDALAAHQVLGGSGPTGPCVADAFTACLLNGRFRATVRFRNGFDNGPVDTLAFRKPVSGFANPSFETVFFYFNSVDNIEITLKMLDQGNVNSQGQATIAVLYGSATPLRTELTVTDTQTGATRTYSSEFASQRGETDFAAFVK